MSRTNSRCAVRQCGRVLVALIVLTSAVLLFASPAEAQIPSDLDTLRIVNVNSVAPGDTFDLDLHLTNSDTLGGFTFRIAYDETQIEPLLDTAGVAPNDTVTVEWIRMIGPANFSQGAFLNFGISSSEPGITQGVFQVFSFDAADLIPPGSGVAFRMRWRALPVATNGTHMVVFENDVAFPSSFNTISDYTGTVLRRPVFTDGAVVVNGTNPPDTTGDTTGTTNNAPTLPALTSPVSVNQGDLITFSVTATDPDGDSLTLLAFNLPTGATFTPANPVGGRVLTSGTFRWTPTLGQSGSSVVSFQATDSAGLTSTIRNVTINVVEIPTDLLFTTSAPGQDPRGGVPSATGVIIPVSLNSVQPSYGVQFDFVYDPTVFSISTLQSTDRLIGFSIYDDLGQTPGRLRVVAFSLNGAPIASGSSSVLFNIIGNVLPGALPGAYDVTFENTWESINPDPNVSSISLTTSDGVVYVDSFGDANLDTRVDVGDVVAIVGYILSDFTFTGRQFGAADVTQNDTLDVFDLVTVINTIFGAQLFQQSPPSSPGSVDFAYDPNDGPYGAYTLATDVPVGAAGAQIEVLYDPGQITLAEPEQLADAAGLEFSWRDNGNGRLVALMFNMRKNESLIRSGGAEVLRIPLYSSSGGTPQVRLRDLKLADPNAERIDVAGLGGLPRSFALSQNYPNPFNAGTTIPFSIESAGMDATVPARLEIFNVLGQKVATLHDGPLAVGRYSMVWDGTDASGQTVASGLYFYRLMTGDESETRKMVLLK